MREVVSQRVVRLEPTSAEVLELASVAGSEFGLDLVRRASGLPEGALLDAVDEATRSGLLLEAPGDRADLSLLARARPPVGCRSAFRGSAGQSCTCAWRRRSSSCRPGRSASATGRLAHHYAQGAAVGAGERAISYNLLAAESAVASLAFDQAIDHLRTALELGIQNLQRASVYLELGRASHRAGRAADALAAFEEAAAIARTLGDAELLAQAATGFEESCWRPGIHDAGSIELLVAGGQPDWRPRRRARRSTGRGARARARLRR